MAGKEEGVGGGGTKGGRVWAGSNNLNNNKEDF